MYWIITCRVPEFILLPKSFCTWNTPKLNGLSSCLINIQELVWDVHHTDYYCCGLFSLEPKPSQMNLNPGTSCSPTMSFMSGTSQGWIRAVWKLGNTTNKWLIDLSMIYSPILHTCHKWPVSLGEDDDPWSFGGFTIFHPNHPNRTARFWVTDVPARTSLAALLAFFRCFFVQRIENLRLFLSSWVCPTSCGLLGEIPTVLGLFWILCDLGTSQTARETWKVTGQKVSVTGWQDYGKIRWAQLNVVSLLVISGFWAQVFQISQHALPHLQRVKQLQLLRCLHHVMPISCSEQNYASVVSPQKNVDS